MGLTHCVNFQVGVPGSLSTIFLGNTTLSWGSDQEPIGIHADETGIFEAFGAVRRWMTKIVPTKPMSTGRTEGWVMLVGEGGKALRG